MANYLIDYAEELFLANHFVSAYKIAKTAQQLDPFFGSVDRYVAAFRTHAAALKRNAAGEPDWYDVLGLPYSVPDQAITHRFCHLGKLMHPDNHCSAAAKGAYKLASEAFEILSDPHSRASFHSRWGLPLLLETQVSASLIHKQARPLETSIVRTGVSSSTAPKSYSRTAILRITESPLVRTEALKACASTKFKKEVHSHHCAASSRVGLPETQVSASLIHKQPCPPETSIVRTRVSSSKRYSRTALLRTAQSPLVRRALRACASAKFKKEGRSHHSAASLRFGLPRMVM